MSCSSERYRGQLDEKADKYIAYAADGAARMSGLIRDLLAYSRVNSRGEQLRPDAGRRSLAIRADESRLGHRGNRRDDHARSLAGASRR